MKNTTFTHFSILAAGLLILAGCSNSGLSGQNAQLNSQIDSVSYSMGYLSGTNLASMGVDEFNYENFAIGIRDAIQENEPHFSEDQMMAVYQTYQFELQGRQAAQRAEEAEANRMEAEEFFAENAEAEGVMTTDSGLQYRVIEEGNGNRPLPTDTVEVHYRGTLLNGEEFDSSYSRGETVQFPLNGVIPGWSEGVQLMSEGATYEFFIPSELGYGDNPPPGSPIAPGSALIFEVELIDILSEE